MIILFLSFLLSFNPIQNDTSRFDFYEPALANLDNSKIENLETAIVLFDSLSVDPPDLVNDKMFEAFQDYYYKTIRYINSNNIIDESIIYEYDDMYNNPYSDSLTTIFNKYGIDIFSTEGSFYADQMVGYLSKTFSDKLTDAYDEYLKRRANEMRRAFSEDAILLVSFSTVANRMFFWEAFLEKYPDSHISSSARFYYEHYLGTLLTGTDNSRIYDWETDKIRDDIVDLYEKMISQYPDRNSTQILLNYLEVIKQNEFIFNENVREYIKTNNLPSMLAVQPISR